MHINRANSHQTDWEDLRFFAAFLRCGSMTAAAKELRADHATVSRRIAALERALGTSLLDRRTRIPELTSAGRRVAQWLKPMEEAAFAAERAAGSLQDRVGGEVRLSTPPALLNSVLIPRLQRLRLEHPDIRLTLIGEKRTASLSRREADVALRLVKPKESGLVCRKLAEFGYGLYAARQYTAQHSSAKYEFIGLQAPPKESPQQKWLLSEAGERALTLTTNDLESQLAAVRAGLGVAALPHFLAAPFSAELTAVPSSCPGPKRSAWFAVHRDLQRAPLVRTLLAFLSEALNDLR